MQDRRDNYLLARDFHASTRLYFQHWMWSRELGYLIHPRIPIGTGDNIKIADVACGNGIWLIDLAKQLPNATLDGFDISTAQFPHKNWLPARVTLHQLDALGDIPPELLGQYDMVHVALVVLAVRGGDPGVLLDRLLSLLKPGGYLQWNEADIEDMPRIPAGDDVPRENCDMFYTQIWKAVERTTGSPMRVQWVRKLGGIMSTHSEIETVLVDEQRPVPDDLAQPASQAHLLSCGEVLDRLDESVVVDMNLVDLYHGAMDEMQRGMSVRMGQVVVVARKRQAESAKSLLV